MHFNMWICMCLIACLCMCRCGKPVKYIAFHFNPVSDMSSDKNWFSVDSFLDTLRVKESLKWLLNDIYEACLLCTCVIQCSRDPTEKRRNRSSSDSGTTSHYWNGVHFIWRISHFNIWPVHIRLHQLLPLWICEAVLQSSGIYKFINLFFNFSHLSKQ